METVIIAITINAIVTNLFLFALGTIYTPKRAPKISTKPTNIWSKYTLSPNLSKLKRVPSYMNSTEKLISPVIMDICLRDLYLNKSK